MEHVKDDLQYSEIGGIYVMAENSGDWKLMTSDLDLNRVVDQTKSNDHIDFYIDNVIDRSIRPIKKMQPHVVMRPRPNLVAGTMLTSCIFSDLFHLNYCVTTLHFCS